MVLMEDLEVFGAPAAEAAAPAAPAYDLDERFWYAASALQRADPGRAAVLGPLAASFAAALAERCADFRSVVAGLAERHNEEMEQVARATGSPADIEALVRRHVGENDALELAWQE